MGKAEAHEWLTFAANDLESAEFLLGMPERKLEIICYHAQQCAEKALKALLTMGDVEVLRTHDLRLLATTVADLGYNNSSFIGDLALLQPYSVAVRYPFGLDLVPGDEVIAIASARQVYQVCRRIFEDFPGQ